jgi:energy-coupling factor transport system ATP-binding protein
MIQNPAGENNGQESIVPAIEFNHFTFRYRSQKEPSLQDINLKIMPGEKVLIIGPSGSGKSTLAHCINGLIPCSFTGETSGTCRVEGEDPGQVGIFGMSKKVGTVLQDTDGQFIGLTVAEDLAFALENDTVAQPEMHARVNAIAETVDLTHLLHHAPGELSGGQKQRVSMGGVLIDNVDILLFDEPLANLDPATGKKTIALIDEIRKNQNVTVIIIEHRLEDVLYRDVDRIVVIGDGHVIADEKPDDLLAGDLLEKSGIREPLYLAAIRHAGCIIHSEDAPQHIATMNLKPYQEKVRQWFLAMPQKHPVNNNPTVLEVKDLSFSYLDNEPVLSHISFSVKQGEMLSIVGKNGAGKSTLASLICGFNTPNEGSIYLDGSDIAPLSIKQRGEKIGLVMQNPNQMISKPMIFDEVALGLAVRNVPEEEIKERVNETLKICGLYPYRNWPVSALSFGQKKRVTIASILVMKPEIILLDEPTAGQDYYHYTEFMEFLKKLNEETGITVIMITHDMHLMLEYTNRAVVICDGQLICDDTPAAVLCSEEVTERAYLKKTSLFDLAVKCGIDEPAEFAQRFISYERAMKDKEADHE